MVGVVAGFVVVNVAAFAVLVTPSTPSVTKPAVGPVKVADMVT